MEEKSIQPSYKEKQEKRQLTAKNKQFLQHLASGRPTLEAYRLAGYTGDNHAAYQLRSDLKQQLAFLLEQGGFSREQLGVEINRLNELPLDPDIKNVNFRQKLDILRLMEKATAKSQIQGEKPKVTPFLIAINKPGSVVVNEDSKDMHARMDDAVERTDGVHEDLQ